jgi:hypothetical protein
MMRKPLDKPQYGLLAVVKPDYYVDPQNRSLMSAVRCACGHLFDVRNTDLRQGLAGCWSCRVNQGKPGQRPTATLSVEQMRAMRSRGMTLVEIGRAAGVTRQAVHQRLQP